MIAPVSMYDDAVCERIRLDKALTRKHYQSIRQDQGAWQKAVKVLSGLPPTHFFLFYRTLDPGLRMSVTDSLTNLFNKRFSIDKVEYSMLTTSTLNHYHCLVIL